MKKIFSYITGVLLLLFGFILIIVGVIDGLKLTLIIFGLILSFIGYIIPKVYKNQKSIQDFENSLIAINTYVAGVTFRQDNVQQAYEEYLKDDELVVDLVLDPDNDFNSDAVKVLINNTHVGYIPNRDLKKYYSYLNAYDYVNSNVDFKVKKDIFIDLTIYFKK